VAGRGENGSISGRQLVTDAVKDGISPGHFAQAFYLPRLAHTGIMLITKLKSCNYVEYRLSCCRNKSESSQRSYIECEKSSG